MPLTAQCKRCLLRELPRGLGSSAAQLRGSQQGPADRVSLQALATAKWLIDCRAPYRQNPTLPYMAKLTIGRMANLYGLHRSTLHEAVAKGRVTAGLDGKGQKIIDLSEMIRVYGEPHGLTLHRPTPAPYTSPTLETDALHPLIEEVRLLREEIRELRDSIRLIEHKPAQKLVVKASKPEEATTWANLLNALDDD